MTRKVTLGADHAGYALKEDIKKLLEQHGCSVEDIGTHNTASSDYPDFAHRVATLVAEKKADFGVLICGTGVGMSIAANRHAGVRAALCNDLLTAEMAKKHNDANVLCIGARVVGASLAGEITKIFFATDFEGGRHTARVNKIEL